MKEYNAEDIIKIDNVKHCIEQIMKELELPITPSNQNTPYRIAKMLCVEMFDNRNDRHLKDLDARMKLFPNEYMDSEFILVKDMDFNSMCEHHWLPFSGKVTVGYVPDKYVIGLSKIPRVVRYFSKRPQLQEQLTKQIGDYLFNLINPHALYVEVEATHQCVKCRGAESDCSTKTFYHNTSFYGNWITSQKFRERLK